MILNNTQSAAFARAQTSPSTTQAPVREPQERRANREAGAEAQQARTESVQEYRVLERVEQLASSEKSGRQSSHTTLSDNDVRQAQLVSFNKRGFEASETFLQIQNQDDSGLIIDTFA